MPNEINNSGEEQGVGKTLYQRYREEVRRGYAHSIDRYRMEQSLKPITETMKPIITLLSGFVASSNKIKPKRERPSKKNNAELVNQYKRETHNDPRSSYFHWSLRKKYGDLRNKTLKQAKNPQNFKHVQDLGAIELELAEKNDAVNQYGYVDVTSIFNVTENTSRTLCSSCDSLISEISSYMEMSNNTRFKGFQDIIKTLKTDIQSKKIMDYNAALAAIEGNICLLTARGLRSTFEKKVRELKAIEKDKVILVDQAISQARSLYISGLNMLDSQRSTLDYINFNIIDDIQLIYPANERVHATTYQSLIPTPQQEHISDLPVVTHYTPAEKLTNTKKSETPKTTRDVEVYDQLVRIGAIRSSYSHWWITKQIAPTTEPLAKKLRPLLNVFKHHEHADTTSQDTLSKTIRKKLNLIRELGLTNAMDEHVNKLGTILKVLDTQQLKPRVLKEISASLLQDSEIRQTLRTSAQRLLKNVLAQIEEHFVGDEALQLKGRVLGEYRKLSNSIDREKNHHELISHYESYHSVAMQSKDQRSEYILNTNKVYENAQKTYAQNNPLLYNTNNSTVNKTSSPQAPKNDGHYSYVDTPTVLTTAWSEILKQRFDNHARSLPWEFGFFPANQLSELTKEIKPLPNMQFEPVIFSGDSDRISYFESHAQLVKKTIDNQYGLFVRSEIAISMSRYQDIFYRTLRNPSLNKVAKNTFTMWFSDVFLNTLFPESVSHAINAKLYLQTEYAPGNNTPLDVLDSEYTNISKSLISEYDDHTLNTEYALYELGKYKAKMFANIGLGKHSRLSHQAINTLKTRTIPYAIRKKLQEIASQKQPVKIGYKPGIFTRLTGR